MSSHRTSRRRVLRAAVGSAVLSATPLSIIEAGTKDGSPILLRLEDGTQLKIRKVGEKYRAAHVKGNKTIDDKPTGRFKLSSGEIVELTNGVVTKASTGFFFNKAPEVKLRGKHTFSLWLQ